MSGETGALLLAAVAGYWVLERAATHKGQLKRIGQTLGWLIIVVSVVGVICRVWCLVTGRMGACPLDRGGWSCPRASKGTPGGSL